jgi:hypothetical protein
MGKLTLTISELVEILSSASGKIVLEKSPTVLNETASSPCIPGKWTFLLQQCMKEPKLEPKLVSTLSETKRLVWLFHEIAKQLVSEFQFNQLTALDEKQL